MICIAPYHWHGFVSGERIGMKNIVFIVFLGFFTLFSSASFALSPFSSSCFTMSNGPILQTGSLRSGATWNDPSVIFDRGRFVMYASADTNFDQNIQIWRLVSRNGVTWTLDPQKPVLTRTDRAWDRKSVETPSVVRFNGLYYMFYTGYSGSHNDVKGYRIGYATSVDGIHWTKAPEPLLVPSAPDAWTPNMDFNQYVVAEPGAVVWNKRLMLYFTAIGADMQRNGILQSIGMIETRDGVTWSKPRQVLKPDPVIYSKEKNIKGFSTPAAAVISGKIHLFTNIVTEDPYQQVALHHAWSRDGVTGWQQDTKPFLTRESQYWTKDNIVSPSVLSLGTKTYLWFAGNNGLQLGIGHGMCNRK